MIRTDASMVTCNGSRVVQVFVLCDLLKQPNASANSTISSLLKLTDYIYISFLIQIICTYIMSFSAIFIHDLLLVLMFLSG